MPFFPCAHASNASWKLALKQVVVQLSAQISMQKLEDVPCLGLMYISQDYADAASEMVAMLSQALPQVQHWAGCAGHSVLAGDLHYGKAGALAVMLIYLPAQDYHVFSGISPQLRQDFAAHCALVHGDATTANTAQQLDSLSAQLQCQHLVGGLSDLQNKHVQWAWGSADVATMPASIGGGGVQVGGLSGVVFAQEVDCISVGMQACKPQGASHVITQIDGDGQVVLQLNGRDAVEVLCSPHSLALNSKLVAISPPHTDVHSNCVAPQAHVMRVAGMDAQGRGIVLHGKATQGCVLSLCTHDEQAARTDVRRACAQVWDALTCEVSVATGDEHLPAPTGRSISGAIYIRNQARHPLPDEPQLDAELELIRHALGPVPLMGFTSTHEIEGDQLQYLSAQLLVFTQPLRSFS